MLLKALVLLNKFSASLSLSRAHFAQLYISCVWRAGPSLPCFLIPLGSGALRAVGRSSLRRRLVRHRSCLYRTFVPPPPVSNCAKHRARRTFHGASPFHSFLVTAARACSTLLSDIRSRGEGNACYIHFIDSTYASTFCTFTFAEVVPSFQPRFPTTQRGQRRRQYGQQWQRHPATDGS